MQDVQTIKLTIIENLDGLSTDSLNKVAEFVSLLRREAQKTDVVPVDQSLNLSPELIASAYRPFDPSRTDELIALLDSWVEGDSEDLHEQQDTAKVLSNLERVRI